MKQEVAPGMGNYEAHLRQAAKQLGKTLDEVAPKSTECPGEAFYLWLYFTELHNARGSGGFGPSPIGFETIKAWCDLMGIHLLPWEVKTIKEIDRVFLETTHARFGRTQSGNQQRPGEAGQQRPASND